MSPTLQQARGTCADPVKMLDNHVFDTDADTARLSA